MSYTKLLIVSICLFAVAAAQDYDCVAALETCESDSKCVNLMNNIKPCAEDENKSICTVALLSNFLASDNQNLKNYGSCVSQGMAGSMKTSFTLMENMGDPCSKQNLACVSDFKCLHRLSILLECLN